MNQADCATGSIILIMDSENAFQVNKDVELATSFIEKFGFKVLEINKYETGSNKPDVKAKISKNGNQIVIGIELTQYYGDADHGNPSPGQRLEKIWREIISNRIEQAKIECPHLEYEGWTPKFGQDVKVDSVQR